MNKKGFTLIELIVSITLVSVILVSLLSTLVKLKQTYEVIDEDSDIRIFSASISRHINNDIINNKGITKASCNEEGNICDIKLRNGEERQLKIYTLSLNGTKAIKDSNGNIIRYERTDTSTVSYYDKKTNKQSFLRTIEQENIQNKDQNRVTTRGYKFTGLSLEQHSYDNKKDTTKQDILSILTIHVSDETYNIKLYSTDTVKKTDGTQTPNPPVTGLACTSGNTTLTQGSKYIRGSYEYRYKQESFWTRIQSNQYSWNNISTDGWGVRIVDLSSTTPITDEICATIDGKPIVSTSHMFINSKASSIDVSSLNSSNVVNMESMFDGAEATTINGLNKLDTRNVTNMELMFYNTKISTLDLSSFDTSKVTNMNNMFRNTRATTGYARNSAEANKFNALSTPHKPENLKFTAK